MEDILKKLGHKPLNINESSIGGYLKKKTVMVTGGGGSIGSCISKKLTEAGVDSVIILDEYENGAFETREDIIMSGVEADVRIVICSVCDREALKRAFLKYAPDIVFHAAAHKHVFLMEENPEEAYKNNVEGTRNLLLEAKAAGVERIIFISTDKAANPVNVMGKTKRECELMIRDMDLGNMRVPVVRFGNVAGSNGSVIPLFEKQIEAGVSLTVTDPYAKRYFLTMDEAVSFTLAVGNIGYTGDIFVPDMGEQLRIEDIARLMIKDSGKDIGIRYIGLRPGEKLKEELCGDGEMLVDTEVSGILLVSKKVFSKEL